MSLLEIFLIAASLALDAAIVAVGAGALAHVRTRTALKVALFFGAFQAFMPLLGLLLGLGFRDYLLAYGHIVGFVLLLIVGGKMLLDSFGEEDTEREKDITRMPTLLLLAIATSIDAFVVGITFNFVSVNVPVAIAVIGIVTFLMALGGVYLGKRGKHLLGNRIELAGALVLIALAFKILLRL
jgi:putative Mn2+ efflux pump MntP